MRSVIFEEKELTPNKVVCIGRNYAEHIAELKNETPSSMVIFVKPNSAITRELYYIDEDSHYECELCFLLREGKIAGAALGLDITKRELQNALKAKGLPWERAKAFDKSAVIGEFARTDDVNALNFELFINKELRQKGSVQDMIYKPLEILQEIQTFMSLDDNDIIMSGTPKGVGVYKRGDAFQAKLFCGDKLLKEKVWRAL
jgi:2-keto-4-pentenoate hydratase/2-oxohepta-3-ene-1,7-dioic acid hydratase in catechol pathway